MLARLRGYFQGLQEELPNTALVSRVRRDALKERDLAILNGVTMRGYYKKGIAACYGLAAANILQLFVPLSGLQLVTYYLVYRRQALPAVQEMESAFKRFATRLKLAQTPQLMKLEAKEKPLRTYKPYIRPRRKSKMARKSNKLKHIFGP